MGHCPKRYGESEFRHPCNCKDEPHNQHTPNTWESVVWKIDLAQREVVLSESDDASGAEISELYAERITFRSTYLHGSDQ